MTTLGSSVLLKRGPYDRRIESAWATNMVAKLKEHGIAASLDGWEDTEVVINGKTLRYVRESTTLRKAMSPFCFVYHPEPGCAWAPTPEDYFKMFRYSVLRSFFVDCDDNMKVTTTNMVWRGLSVCATENEKQEMVTRGDGGTLVVDNRKALSLLFKGKEDTLKNLAKLKYVDDYILFDEIRLERNMVFSDFLDLLQ
jgi:hypothetical protein